MEFHKYQGTGNDFVCIDNRASKLSLSKENIQFLSDRKFGIGSDGVILIENHDELDFHMIFYNPDGSQSFCGNGSRCAMLFAHDLGIVKEKGNFLSTDGPHQARFQDRNQNIIGLDMHDVLKWQSEGSDWIINTGSPHYIVFCEDVEAVDLISEAQAIRYSDAYRTEGINVNFVQIVSDDQIRMRTYERGVENETLSCGTGVTAAALAYGLRSSRIGLQQVGVSTRGGELSVAFDASESALTSIVLAGPAKKVFSGSIEI